MERVRIGTDGNVGIGFTQPNSKLHVNGDISLIYPSSITATNIYGELFPSPGTSKLIDVGWSLNGLSGDVVSLYTPGSGSSTPKLSLSSGGVIHLNGNVGIGTTIPQAMLDVNGNTRITGNLFINTYTFSAWNLSLSYGYLTYSITLISSPYFNQTTGIYTAPIKGNYYFSFYGFTDYSGAPHQIVFCKNNSQIAGRSYSQYNYVPISLTHIFFLNAGETLRVRVDTGSLHNVEGNFSGYLINPLP